MKVRFRSRPREILAEQFNDGGPGIPAGVCFCDSGDQGDYNAAHVHTMHDNQAVIVESLDWIVPEPDGVHYYPIKPDVMEQNYVEVIGKATRAK